MDDFAELVDLDDLNIRGSLENVKPSFKGEHSWSRLWYTRLDVSRILHSGKHILPLSWVSGAPVVGQMASGIKWGPWPQDRLEIGGPVWALSSVWCRSQRPALISQSNQDLRLSFSGELRLGMSEAWAPIEGHGAQPDSSHSWTGFLDCREDGR